MYRVNHNEKHLADEFMANPFGRPSPELQRVLIVFRGEPVAGKYVLVCTKPFKEWALAELGGKRGEPVKLLGERFTSLEEAERYVFRKRWKKYTGHDLA
ncbi:MAG: ABC transporter permease [Methylobacteriaceae bacterium]|nr:ABC transporter permease [Methylobacteriaceae bacterium]